MTRLKFKLLLSCSALTFFCAYKVAAQNFDAFAYYQWQAIRSSPLKAANFSQIRTYVIALGEMGSDPQVANKIETLMTKLTAGPVNQDFSLLLAAPISQNPRLMLKAHEILDRVIAGNDAAFNAGRGKDIKTPADRYLFLLRHFMDIMNNGGPLDEKLAGLIGTWFGPLQGDSTRQVRQALLQQWITAPSVVNLAMIRGIASNEPGGVDAFMREIQAQKLKTFMGLLNQSLREPVHVYSDQMELLAKTDAVKSWFKSNWEFWTVPCSPNTHALILIGALSGDPEIYRTIQAYLQKILRGQTRGMLSCNGMGFIPMPMHMESFPRELMQEYQQIQAENNRLISEGDEPGRHIMVFNFLSQIAASTPSAKAAVCQLVTDLQIKFEYMLRQNEFLLSMPPVYGLPNTQCLPSGPANLEDLKRQRAKQLFLNYIRRRFDGPGMGYNPEMAKFLGDPEVHAELQAALMTPDLGQFPRTLLFIAAWLDPDLRSLARTRLLNRLKSQAMGVPSHYRLFEYLNLLGELTTNRQSDQRLQLGMQFMAEMEIASPAVEEAYLAYRGNAGLPGDVLKAYLIQHQGPGIISLIERRAEDRRIAQESGIDQARAYLTQCRQPNQGSLPIYDYPFMQMMKFGFDSAVRGFLKAELTTGPTCRDQAVQLSILLAAQATEDVELQKLARLGLARKLNGLDSDFNIFLGTAGRSIADRLRWITRQFQVRIAGTADLAPLGEEFIHLFSTLEFRDASLQKELEEAATQRKDSLYRTLAQRWLVKAKGMDYLKALQSSAVRNAKKNFVYFNGGYSITSNSHIHEQDLQSFHYGLFDGQSTVLSAGGPDGTAVPTRGGNPYLGTDSMLQLMPSIKLDKPYIAATLDNLKATVAAVPKTSNELTVIFGGHGNRYGLAVWGFKYLRAQDIGDIYRELPESVQVRSMFLQCFAGATIVPPQRILPNNLKSFETFANYYFPKNRCAAATSSDDEVGFYYSSYDSGLDWQRGPWVKMFSSLPIVSLQTIKDYLFEDPFAEATPITTSDYFSRDLAGVLCREREAKRDFVSRFGDNPDTWSTEAALAASRLNWQERTPTWQSRLDAICDSPALSDIVKLRRDQANFVSTRWDNMRALDQNWTHQLLQSEYPELHKEHQEVLNAHGKAGTYPDLNTKLFRDFDILLASLPLNPKYIDYYNAKTQEYLNQNRNLYEGFFEIAWLDTSQKFAFRILDNVRNRVYGRKKDDQADRKKREKVMQNFLRENIEFLLDAPDLLTLKTRYRSIRQCEVSAI
jgi:hypothetical protein